LKSYPHAHGVSFDVIGHARSESAAAEADATQIPEQTAKTVVLRTSASYRLAVIGASDRLDLRKAAEAVVVPQVDVRLATEADRRLTFLSMR